MEEVPDPQKPAENRAGVGAGRGTSDETICFLVSFGFLHFSALANSSLDVKKDVYSIITVIIIEDVKQQCRNRKSLR